MKRICRSRLSNLANYGRGLGVLANLLLIGSLGLPQASAQTTKMIRQGLNSYSGVLDTHILQANTTQVSTATTMNIDGLGGAFPDEDWGQGLFLFGSLFGTGSNQIPVNALVTSATLTFTTDGASSSNSSDTFGLY